MTPPTVSVNVRYWINESTDGEPTKQECFTPETVQPAHMGIPEGGQPSKVNTVVETYHAKHRGLMVVSLLKI